MLVREREVQRDGPYHRMEKGVIRRVVGESAQRLQSSRQCRRVRWDVQHVAGAHVLNGDRFIGSPEPAHLSVGHRSFDQDPVQLQEEVGVSRSLGAHSQAKLPILTGLVVR